MKRIASAATVRKGSSATFSPSYVHRAFGMHLSWSRALESARRKDGRRLPGSARRVLELLMAAKALGMGAASQLGIVRLSDGTMPRATVQDGLRALVECGIVDRSSKGWSIRIHAPSTPSAPCRNSAPVKGEVPSPVNPLKASRGARPGRSPQKESKTSLWAKALREAGFDGAWSVAKSLPHEFHPGAVDAALEIAKGRAWCKDPKGLAACILKEDWGQVERRIKKGLDSAGGTGGRGKRAGNPMDAMEVLRGLEAVRPSSDHPAFLDHVKRERVARDQAVAMLEKFIPDAESQKAAIARGLQAAGLDPNGLVWGRTFAHEWAKVVLTKPAF